MHDLMHAQIAAELGINLRSVERRMAWFRQRVQERLGQATAAPGAAGDAE